MGKYFVEYGALQANARRLIECDTSALPPKKITEKFAREIEDIYTATDLDWDEQQYAWDSLFEDYPDIATMDEFNYRDIVDLPGGYEGIEDGDTIYRFVNSVAYDIYNESIGK